RRHAGVAGERGAQDRDRDGGAGGFAETHAEIEQRREAELVQQRAVGGLGRNVGSARVVERVVAQPPQRRDRRGADEPVEPPPDAAAAPPPPPPHDPPQPPPAPPRRRP